MNVTHKFTTDLQTRGITERIHAMQSDANTRVVEVTLLEGGKEWSPAGATASVAFRNLKDGHKGWYDKLPNGSDACTVNSNVVTATLAPAVLSGDGEVQAAIVFQDAQLNQLATFGFSILVEKNPAAGVAKANDYYAYATMEDISAAVDAMLDSLEDTKAQLGQLVVQVNETVAQVQQEAGPAIVCEAAGDVVAVSDASDRPLQSLTLYGKTTQNGTPSPSNPVPLVSAGSGGSVGVKVTGKNVFSGTVAFSNANGITFTQNADGSVTANGTATAEANITYNISLSPGRYILSGCPANGGHNEYHIRVRNGSFFFDIGTGVEFEGEGADLVQIIINGGQTVSNLTFYPMIRSKSIADVAYEPYKEQPLSLSTPNGLPGIPVTSGGNYTDSNGQQWICDEIDLARGVYVQRVIKKTLNGTESWDNQQIATGIYRLRGYQSDCDLTITNAVLCDKLPVSSTTWGQIEGIGCSGSTLFVYLKDYNTVASVADWKAYLSQNPITCLLPLSTPTETPLDADTLAAYAALHTNKPNTTVMNDAGAGQKLGYVADTKTYIDNKFTEMTNAIIASGANI